MSVRIIKNLANCGICVTNPEQQRRDQPHAFGLYETPGNLWEWCADNWPEDYTSSPRDGSSYQDKTSRYRVACGGSWHEPPALCRSASRLQVLESDADEFTGFGWFVIGPLKAGYKPVAPAYPENMEASCATRANRG